MQSTAHCADRHTRKSMTLTLCQSQTEAILTSDHTTAEPWARLAIALLDQRVLLLGSFENHFNIGFLHPLPQILMHEEPTKPIQNTAQVIEGSSSGLPWLRDPSDCVFYAGGPEEASDLNSMGPNIFANDRPRSRFNIYVR
jgi:hypothetical protein